LELSGPVPRRFDAATKETLLDLVEYAVDRGWTLHEACRALELDRVRAYRWMDRRRAGELADGKPGGHPVGAENPSATVTCDFSPSGTEDLGLF
jgi:hypothetical protein